MYFFKSTVQSPKSEPPQTRMLYDHPDIYYYLFIYLEGVGRSGRSVWKKLTFSFFHYLQLLNSKFRAKVLY